MNDVYSTIVETTYSGMAFSPQMAFSTGTLFPKLPSNDVQNKIQLGRHPLEHTSDTFNHINKKSWLSIHNPTYQLFSLCQLLLPTHHPGLEQPPSWSCGVPVPWRFQTGVKGPPAEVNPISSFLLAPVHNSICTWHKFLLPKSTHVLTRSAYIFDHLKAALYKEEGRRRSMNLTWLTCWWQQIFNRSSRLTWIMHWNFTIEVSDVRLCIYFIVHH